MGTVHRWTSVEYDDRVAMGTGQAPASVRGLLRPRWLRVVCLATDAVSDELVPAQPHELALHGRRRCVLE